MIITVHGIHRKRRAEDTRAVDTRAADARAGVSQKVDTRAAVSSHM